VLSGAAEPLAGAGVRRRCAVLGSPVAHSRSPALHRAAYAALDLAWSYDAVEVDRAGLAGFVAGLGPEWVGLSLTRPLKVAALACAHDADGVARRTGVANTLVRRDDGWVAHNTDARGLRLALADVGVAPEGTACVLGGGATARSSIWALANGVDRVQVLVLVRDPVRAAVLAALDLPVQVEVGSMADPSARRSGLAADLVIDTTPPGAVDWLAIEVVAGPGTYVDWTYVPWPTPLAGAYAEAGRTVVGGLDLLLQQAGRQVALMTGRPAPLTAMRAALSSP